MKLKLIVFITLLIVIHSTGFSEIIRLDGKNIIWIMDFPRHAPATMDDLIKADIKHGWNLIKYNSLKDVYTVNATLWIGSVSSWKPSYFQIGRIGHERETVIIHGDVWVRAPRKSLPRADGRSGLINRLTLGMRDNENIKATLKIACERNKQYGIYIGERTEESGTIIGGELLVFNSTITANVQDGKHNFKGTEWINGYHTGWYASRVELKNAEISYFNGNLAFGLLKDNYVIEGTIFEKGHGLLNSREHKLVDCSFINMKKYPVGANLTEFIRCEFKNNDSNFSVSNYLGVGVEMINCKIGQQKKPMSLRKNTRFDLKTLMKKGVPQYPFYVERQSCVVKVIDMNKQPISGAVVSIKCQGDRYANQEHIEAVRNPIAVTDSKGLTPSCYEDEAILPAIKRLQATDNEFKPAEHSLKYFLTVEAEGYITQIMPLQVSEISKIKIVKLKIK